MKQFNVTIQEKVTLWQDVNVVVEAESKEDILASIKRGDFLHTYEILEEESIDTLWDTMDHLEYDYFNTQDCDIEEID